MPKRIIKVLKKMGTGLEAAHSKGAMNTTENKVSIMLGESKQAEDKTTAEKPKLEADNK